MEIEEINEQEQQVVRVSVRNLVEYILRSGDIDNRFGALQEDAMQQGSRLHKKLQKAAGPDYQSEVSMKLRYPSSQGIAISVEGRADGIISSFIMDDSTGVLSVQPYITIDEIKATYRDLGHIQEPGTEHLAQACCYAHMYCRQEGLEKIGVQITYVHIETGKIKRFTQERQAKDLEVWFQELVERYSLWAKWQLDWQARRNESITKVRFPFEYRDSQRTLVSGVYRTILQGKRLFIQAPTGTGKTLAAVFPTVKAMGEGLCGKIFYLTAKTIARTVAEETFKLLNQTGLEMKVITLTAKEKLCVLEEMACNPLSCPRAKGHFDRVNDGVYDLINHEDCITREVIDAYAKKHQVCPFEMQLDVSLWMDTIICDYNYVFDPKVYLKRFFGERKENYVFLIDEAHNMVERAREMYSANLHQSMFSQTAEAVQFHRPKLALKIEKCKKYLMDLDEQWTHDPEERGEITAGDEGCKLLDNVGGLILYLERMVGELETFLREEMPQKLREILMTLYFETKSFIDTFDAMDERYVTYMERKGRDFMVKLFCVDPSYNMGLRLGRGRSAVFFSATLLPVAYYKELLSDTGAEDYDMYVDSPFDTDRRLLMLATDVSSRYSRRTQGEYQKIASYIRQIVRSKNGNYLVFFPSYVFMNSVYDIFTEMLIPLAGSGIEVVMQEMSMSEEARQNFLDSFEEHPNSTTIGFCVLGGIFSEGIDLKADRLIGVLVVGTGLPQIGNERELLRDYYDKKQGRGFDYAYLYPGMNKVLQAGGRVIRTEADKGVIALLDQRFNFAQYKQLFPREWYPHEKVNLKTVETVVNDFWAPTDLE